MPHWGIGRSSASFAKTSNYKLCVCPLLRGTFYLHFADKYTLTETVVREVFRQELERALPATPGWDRSPCNC
jgi:hypothetical protein